MASLSRSRRSTRTLARGIAKARELVAPSLPLTSPRLRAENNSLLRCQVVPQLRLNFWYLFYKAWSLMFYMHPILDANKGSRQVKPSPSSSDETSKKRIPIYTYTYSTRHSASSMSEGTAGADDVAAGAVSLPKVVEAASVAPVEGCCGSASS